MINARILDELSCWCRAKSDYERFCFVVDGLIVLPLCVVGLAGNVLSIIVLNHDTAVNYATTLLLSAIAVVDNVYLLSCLVYQTGKAICYGTSLTLGLRAVYPQVSLIGAVSGNGIIKINLLLHAFPVVTAKEINVISIAFRHRSVHDGHNSRGTTGQWS